jgi:hypothetical protein
MGNLMTIRQAGMYWKRMIVTSNFVCAERTAVEQQQH